MNSLHFMLKFIYKIKKKKFDFFLPQKSTFLIFDTYSNTVEKYKGNELFHELIGNYPYSVFDITGSVNVLILLKSILTNFSRIPLTEFYIKTYIESVSPKCVITNVDNNLLFYKIKNLVDYKITTISIQNGLGDKSALKNLKENEGCDYIFTFSDSYSNIFLKYIKNAKCITIGSLKNNIYNKSIFKKEHQITYISNYTPPPKNDINEIIFYDNDSAITWIDFYKDEIYLIQNIAKSCAILNLKLTICGRTFNVNQHEFKFYENLLKDIDWLYIPRKQNSIFSSYDVVFNSNLVVSLDSTLGYESISRGIRTVFFPHRMSFGEKGSNSFGWPSFFPKSGSIWTISKDFENIYTIIKNTLELSELEWVETYKKISKNIIEYDPEMYMLKLIINNFKII